MTVAELITELSKHNPDTPVRACVWFEFGSPSYLDIPSVERGVDTDGPFVVVNAE